MFTRPSWLARLTRRCMMFALAPACAIPLAAQHVRTSTVIHMVTTNVAEVVAIRDASYPTFAAGASASASTRVAVGANTSHTVFVLLDETTSMDLYVRDMN